MNVKALKLFSVHRKMHSPGFGRCVIFLIACMRSECMCKNLIARASSFEGSGVVSFFSRSFRLKSLAKVVYVFVYLDEEFFVIGDLCFSFFAEIWAIAFFKFGFKATYGFVGGVEFGDELCAGQLLYFFHFVKYAEDGVLAQHFAGVVEVV